MAEQVSNEPQRVMVVVAHPDDAEFMAAGTLARWAREGKEVYYVLCTSGGAGSSDPTIDPRELMATREAEQRAACKIIGAKEVVFLGYPDGALQNTLELRKDIVRQIRRVKPHIIVTEDPTMRLEGSYINHPDHRAAGDATLDAVFPSARDYHAFPDLIQEGHLPHKVQEVYLAGRGDQHNVWIDIAETIDLKVEALRAHKSQVGQSPERLASLEERIKEWARSAGEAQGMRYAEGFHYIKLLR